MKTFKDIIKQGGDDAFERAMRRYGVDESIVSNLNTPV